VALVPLQEAEVAEAGHKALVLVVSPKPALGVLAATHKLRYGYSDEIFNY